MSTDTTNNDLTPNIQKLELNDTLYTWFIATNKLIDYVNPIQLYDLTIGRGLTETRLNGVVNLQLNVGKGIKLYPDGGAGDLTVDIEGIYSALASVRDSDYLMFERSDTGSSNYLFSVHASDILPPTINGNHEFMGDITTSSLDTRDGILTLGSSGLQASAGIKVYSGTSYENSFLYQQGLKAWISTANILLPSNKAFLTNSTNKDASFRFSTNGTQYDVVLELAMGYSSTSNDNRSWKIEGRHYLNRLDFVYNSTATTDVDHVVFSGRIDNPNTATSTFVVADKIEIGNIAQSTTNFSQITNYTQYKIPISNSDGVLDKGWTNRYVTSDYISLSVGNIVKIFDNTNNDTYITRCDLSTTSTNEADTYTFGIVERISGGKAYIVMLGEFNLSSTPSPALEPGLTYYLSSGTTNYTKVKPTSGMVKPVFVATGAASGIIFPMTSGTLSFGNVSVSAAGGLETGYIVGSGSTVYSNNSNGNIQLVAGNGITLQTDNSNKKVTIRALTQGNEPGYSKIKGDSGDSIITAITPFDTLRITGGGGGINVALDENTDNDQVILTGKYFRRITIAGDETNADFATITAGVDADLTLYGGVGIRLTNPASNLIRIEATGDLAATIANYSLTLKQIQKQPKNSVLVTGGTSTLTEVTALQATTRSILMYTGLNTMTWATPLTFFSSGVSSGGGLPIGTITPSSTRFLGISAHTVGNTTPIGGVNGTASFLFDDYYKPNSINNVRMALIQGDGITLSVVNSSTNSNWVGVPGIKISNSDTTSKFRNVVITNTNETIAADVNGVLRLTSPSGSPIFLDGDSNSDTVYFNVSNGTITNYHLRDMPDNTVKVGLGSTSNNTPTDLTIGTNSVLGRLSGELQSLSASNLRTILGLSGSKYFNGLLTDSGSVYSTETETLSVRGGPGISVSVGTNNEILITNTIPGIGDGGITVVGTRSRPTFSIFGNTYTYTDGITGINKLYFGVGDIKCSFDKSGTSGVIVQQISWDTLGLPLNTSVNSVDDGIGLMYAGIVAGESFTSKFAQIGNGVSGYQIPYFNPDTQELDYVNYLNITKNQSSEGASGVDGYVLTFANDGTLTTTRNYVNNVIFDIQGISVARVSDFGGIYGPLDSRGVVIYETGEQPVTFNQVKTNVGMYWSTASGFRMETTEGRDFIFATSQTTANFTDTVRLKFAQSLTLNTSETPAYPEYTTISGTDIIVRNFSSNWYQLSSSKLCMPTIMVGTGPTNATATTSNGYLIRNDAANGSLVFTNYNLNTYGSRTTEKDRSSRLTLEVMNVDSASSNAYASLKTSGSITHTYTDVSTTPGLVDSFTVSGRKSVKYLIQAVNNSGKAFTTEFIVQVNTSTNYCNYIQYASVFEPAGFSLDITATLATNTVTVSNNSVSQGITLTSVKVLKLEI